MPGYLQGTGLTTNVVYVQDLALWLPLLAVSAAWLWQRRPWGYLLAGAGLAMWVLESVSIAVDQFTECDSSSAEAPNLTGAEMRLLPLLATHLSFPEIGTELFLSPNTVKSQAISIYRKLEVSSRREAVAGARECGLLER